MTATTNTTASVDIEKVGYGLPAKIAASIMLASVSSMPAMHVVEKTNPQPLVKNSLIESVTVSKSAVDVQDVLKEKKSSASSLLKFAGKWSGSDFDETLEEVVGSRSTARF